MIYCRTSRYEYNITTWRCNICLSCSKKYIPSYEFIDKKGIKIDAHNHELIYMITNRYWRCNLCRKNYDNNIPTYYCTNCDYDVCSECMSQLSDENNYSLIIHGMRKNYSIKSISDSRHYHPLMYCNISRGRNSMNTWYCDNCKKEYNNEWSFYCSICDYNLCYKCIF